MGHESPEGRPSRTATTTTVRVCRLYPPVYMYAYIFSDMSFSYVHPQNPQVLHWEHGVLRQHRSILAVFIGGDGGGVSFSFEI